MLQVLMSPAMLDESWGVLWGKLVQGLLPCCAVLVSACVRASNWLCMLLLLPQVCCHQHAG